jgi:hypothetical protein
MRKDTESVKNSCRRIGATHAQRPLDPNAERLASLAAMTMARQMPGLVLPAFRTVPVSYTYTQGTDTALTLAKTLVQLGLGTPELWKRHNCNVSRFIKDSLNLWLSEVGADEMKGEVDVDLAVIDELDGDSEPHPDGLYMLLDTSDGCGFMTIGAEVELLEAEHPGLGRAFYLVLMGTMNQWMDVYDTERARYFVDGWKESIEQDIECDGDVTQEAFDQYLKERDIDFPDLDGAVPDCLKKLTHKEYRSARTLLKKHSDGPYAQWIEPLLVMDAVKQRKDEQSYRDLEQSGCWDDGPLPTWVLAFKQHDPITQAFDDQAAGFNECSHAPTWITRFDPADKKVVKEALDRVEGFVMVNRQIVKINKLFENRRQAVGNSNQSQLHGQLRAA